MCTLNVWKLTNYQQEIPHIAGPKEWGVFFVRIYIVLKWKACIN